MRGKLKLINDLEKGKFFFNSIWDQRVRWERESKGVKIFMKVMCDVFYVRVALLAQFNVVTLVRFVWGFE